MISLQQKKKATSNMSLSKKKGLSGSMENNARSFTFIPNQNGMVGGSSSTTMIPLKGAATKVNLVGSYQWLSKSEL